MKFSPFLVILALFVFILIIAPLAFGQVTAGATASAINYKGAWTIGTEQTQSIPLVYWGAQKGNIFSLGSREVINPGVFNAYGVLGSYSPDISALIKKTTFSPDQFAVSFDVMGGIATMPTGPARTALEGRVNVSYALTPNTALTGAYAGGGLIGQDPFYTVSAGFAYLFGGPSNTQSLAKKRFIQKFALKHPTK
jgi:hypothetical protein